MAVQRRVSPDGGWGWVVTCATALIYFVVFGFQTSQGLLVVGLMREFYPNDRARLTLIPIICNGISRLLAPLAVFLSSVFSYRVVVFISGLLVTFGCILSFFATSIEFLYVSFGVVIGIGASLGIYPSAILSTLYFDKHVSLANGIYTAGASVGCITLPLLVEYLLNSYGVADTFMYLGCVMLHICVAAALFQPIERHLKIVDEKEELEAPPIDRPVTHMLLDIKASEMDVKQQLKEKRVVLTRFSHIPSSLRTRQKINPILLNPRCIPTTPLSFSNGGLPNPKQTPTIPEEVLQRQISTSSHVSIDDYWDGRRESHQSSFGRSSRSSSRLSLTILQGLRRASLPFSHPTDRIVRCPLASEPDIPEEEEKQTPEQISNSLFSFFRNPQFYLLTLSTTGLYVNLATFPIITPDYALEEIEGTNSMDRAAYLMSATALADLLTRASLSWVWDLSCINRRYWFLAGNIVGGSALFTAGFAQSYSQLMICVVINGIMTGISGVLIAVLCMQIIGPKSFGMALTTSSLVGGLFMISTGSFIGIIKEQTGSYVSCFWLIGGYQMFGSIFWAIVNVICCRDKN